MTDSDASPHAILAHALATVPGLDPGAAAGMSPDEIRDAYNGCGPERWPQAVRAALDAMTSLYAPAVIVHDCDFTLSDGSEEGLADATARFRANTAAILRHRYPLLSWSVVRPSYRAARRRAAAVRAALDLAVSPALCRAAWREADAARRRAAGEDA